MNSYENTLRAFPRFGNRPIAAKWTGILGTHPFLASSMTTNTVSGSSSTTLLTAESVARWLTIQLEQATAPASPDGQSPPPRKKTKRGPLATASKEMHSDEYTLQRDCISWLKSEYPNLRGKFTATVGGASLKSGPASYNKLRASGYLPGIPDVLIFKAHLPFHGLFIEMKTPRGRVTEEQQAVHAALREEGYLVEVCRTFKAFKFVVNTYMNCGWCLAKPPPPTRPPPPAPLHDLLGYGNHPSPILE